MPPPIFLASVLSFVLGAAWDRLLAGYVRRRCAHHRVANAGDAATFRLPAAVSDPPRLSCILPNCNADCVCIRGDV